MTLAELQHQFRDYLLDRPNQIAALGANAPEVGLAVYHHAYRAQLLACLADTYAKVWSWIGDEGFERAGRRHIDDHPPSSWTLNDYGSSFPDTLAALYPDDPEVAELGRLDWALRRAFDGADAEPVDLTSLAEVDWETARIGFVPTLRLFDITTNCAAIWNALAAEETPPPVERLPAPAAIRVWRLGLAPQFQTIDASERRALDLALAGSTFAEVCAALVRMLDESQVAALAGQWLAAWLREGLVATVASGAASGSDLT
jgi:hypothetical protein